MKLTKLLALVLSLLLMTAPALAEAAEAAPETVEEVPAAYTVEAKTFPYLHQFDSDKDPDEGEMTLYFVNGGDIPYVALDEYAAFLSGVLAQLGKEGIDYKVEKHADSEFSVTREDNGSALFVNTDNEVLYFLNLNGFTQSVGSKAAVTVMDLPEAEPIDLDQMSKAALMTWKLMNGEDVNPDDLGLDTSSLPDEEKDEDNSDAVSEAEDDGDQADDDQADGDQAADANKEKHLFTMAGFDGYYHNRLGDMVEFKLGDYDIDLIAVDDKCYIPFQTMNDIFLGMEYLQYIFTGERVLGCAYQAPLADQRFDVEPHPFSESFAMFNYNELRFLLDNFYGLKPEHNIKDFGTLMAMETGLVQDLAGTDPRKFDLALMVLTGRYMDDGHSGFLSGSVLAGEQDPLLNTFASSMVVGPSSKAMSAQVAAFDKARRAVYRSWVPGYEEVGDTAFITFDGFTQAREDAEYYKTNLFASPDPQDTIDLIIYANEQIKRENSPIRNIVMDLSNNGGGMASAAVFVMSWFLGDASVTLRDTLTGAQTNMSYHCDVDRDGTYDEELDTVSKGYNLYCLTSMHSFSCGNLVPAACAESGKVTMVGQTSGGGSCVVLPCTTASGALFQISGTHQLSIMKNGSFYNIDSGIVPDIVLTKPESFYDRAALAEYLKQAK